MILRLLIILVIIYLLYKMLKGILPSLKEKSVLSNQPLDVMEDLVEDPNCHTYVPKSNAYETSINGKRIYFCSRKCFMQYKDNLENSGT